MTHEERERTKDEARVLLGSAKTTRQRVAAMIMFMEAYFDRNPKCPNFEAYAAHYLWASRNEVPEDALKVLVRRYPKPKQPKIRTGYSDWFEKGHFA